MHVITLAQQKGGVGKSNLALHLAAEAGRSGRAVVLELDRQGTSSTWHDTRSETGGGQPDVMRVDSTQLAPTLHTLKGVGLDYVFLDLPGTHSPAVNAAIKAADLVLIPARPQEVDIGASAETLGVVQRLKRRYAYVLTFIPATGSRAGEAREALEEAGHPVAPGGIGLRASFVEAITAGKTVQETEPRGKAAGEIRALWTYVQAQLEDKQ